MKDVRSLISADCDTGPGHGPQDMGPTQDTGPGQGPQDTGPRTRAQDSHTGAQRGEPRRRPEPLWPLVFCRGAKEMH